LIFLDEWVQVAKQQITLYPFAAPGRFCNLPVDKNYRQMFLPLCL